MFILLAESSFFKIVCLQIILSTPVKDGPKWTNVKAPKLPMGRNLNPRPQFTYIVCVRDSTPGPKLS